MTVQATIAPVHEPSARWGAAYATPVDTSLVGGLPALKWPPSPGGLLSLWDMVRLDVQPFALLMEKLGRFVVGGEIAKVRLADATYSEAAVVDTTTDWVENHAYTRESLEQAAKVCDDLALPVTKDKVSAVLKMLGN